MFPIIILYILDRMANAKNTMSKTTGISLIVLMLTMMTSLSFAFTAYDCDKPAVADRISLFDVESCPDASPSRIATKQQIYHVYQETLTSRTMVTECRLQTAEFIWHCGSRYQTTVKDMQLIPADDVMTKEQCIQAKTHKQFSVDKHRTLKAEINKRLVQRMFMGGRVDEEGYSQAGEVFDRGRHY